MIEMRTVSYWLVENQGAGGRVQGSVISGTVVSGKLNPPKKLPDLGKILPGQGTEATDAVAAEDQKILP